LSELFDRLAGTAALSSALGGSLDCSFYNGPHCSQLNALEAFGWICWIVSRRALVHT
jgi:hypothetical protein